MDDDDVSPDRRSLVFKVVARRPVAGFSHGSNLGGTHTIDRRVQADYKRSPAWPCVMSEGAYDDGPEYPTGPVDALMIRKQAYWSYFAGGTHTYGNTNVWHFGTSASSRTQDWKAVLHSPAAESMTTLKRIMDSLPWWMLVPAPNVRIRQGEIGSVNPLHAVVRATDGSGAIVYFCGPDKVTVDLAKASKATHISAIWIDPTSGASLQIGRYATAGEETFESPKGWKDALLILDGGFGVRISDGRTQK